MMKLSVGGVAMSAAIVWGGAVLVMGLANLVWPHYGVAFFEVLESMYPGYQAQPMIGEVLVATGYAVVDGLVCGSILAWLYNRFSGGTPATASSSGKPEAASAAPNTNPTP